MFWNSSALSNKKSSANKMVRDGGFGLIELMVSISIMAIVASIILTRQSTFNSAVLLRGQAYKIALQVREIQLSAVSASSDGSNGFRSVLGLQFNSNPLSNSLYRIFRDANDDGFYDQSPIDEAYGIQGILDKRFEIREIRSIGDTFAGTEISVVFIRPNFDARFFDINGEVNATSVEIDIARRGVTGTGDGVLRTLEITSTGQIAVQ